MITKYKNGNIDIRLSKEEIDTIKKESLGEYSELFMIGAEYYHNQMEDLKISICELKDGCHYLVDFKTRTVCNLPTHYSNNGLDLMEDFANELASGKTIKFKYAGKRKNRLLI